MHLTASALEAILPCNTLSSSDKSGPVTASTIRLNRPYNDLCLYF